MCRRTRTNRSGTLRQSSQTGKVESLRHTISGLMRRKGEAPRSMATIRFRMPAWGAEIARPKPLRRAEVAQGGDEARALVEQGVVDARDLGRAPGQAGVTGQEDRRAPPRDRVAGTSPTAHSRSPGRLLPGAPSRHSPERLGESHTANGPGSIQPREIGLRPWEDLDMLSRRRVLTWNRRRRLMAGIARSVAAQNNDPTHAARVTAAGGTRWFQARPARPHRRAPPFSWHRGQLPPAALQHRGGHSQRRRQGDRKPGVQ